MSNSVSQGSKILFILLKFCCGLCVCVWYGDVRVDPLSFKLTHIMHYVGFEINNWILTFDHFAQTGGSVPD